MRIWYKQSNKLLSKKIITKKLMKRLTKKYICIILIMFSIKGGIFMKNKILLQLNIEDFLCEIKVIKANETIATNKEINVIKLT